MELSGVWRVLHFLETVICTKYNRIIRPPVTVVWEDLYKKLSYCWETVRRESMLRIAEMDVEITT